MSAMSERDSNSESGSGHRNIVLTPEEKKVFGQLFQAADSDKLGVVTGELAVKFFEKSGLNPRILGEIWGIADTENRGLLTKVGFSVALRLIGQAQNGQHPRPELAQHPGPLPKFDGVNITYPPPPMTSSPPPPPPPVQQAQLSGQGGMIRVPPLAPQDVERFTGLFEKSGAQDGVLPGDVAKGIFQRAKLPNQTLGLIWNLADRQHRGVLGPAEFVVAMHLITCSKNGSLPVLPQILPPGLYEAAAGRLPTRNGPDRRGAGRGLPPTVPPVPPIPNQFSGHQQRAQSPLSRQFTPPITQALPRQGTGDWAISAVDKARFDQVFLTIDKQNRGFITGEEAVPFFGNSNLPEDILASIWDLADITKAGKLNRDEFAIAMHLIRQQRNSPDARALPEVLPLNLIPPAMRFAIQPAPSAYEPPPPPVPPPPKTASDDLFDLDFSSPPPPPAASAPPQTSLVPFDTDVFGMKSAPVTGPTTPMPPQQAPNFFNTAQRAFVPTSSFGQTMISPSQTGGSTSSAPANRAQPSMMDDLLGDADPEISKKLTSETTELANLSNQIGSLTKQTTELKSKRASAEQELSTLSTQKQHIEMQLASLRSAYEREAEHVKTVENQLAALKAEITQIRTEYTAVDASYNELQSRKQELTSALESDKRENETLDQHMKVINAENISLRAELDRLQSQARQQRGLVAINKKQVSTGDQERERLRGEIDDTRREITSPPPPGSPTPSTASINTNPFHRRSPPAAPETAFSPSPFAPGNPAPPQATTLEDVFGPSFAVSPMPTGSSLTSFQRAQTEPSASEGNPEHSTPPTSPPGSSYHGSPQPSEAPPVSAAVQMNPTFLPFQINRTDSLSSSVQAHPSASQHGDNDFSRPDTPTNWATGGETPAKEREAFVKVEDKDRRSSFSVKSDAGTEASVKVSFPGLDGPGKDKDRSPFGGVERNTTGSTTGGMKAPEKRDSFSSYAASTTGIPGAFPNFDSTVPIKPTATGESTMSNKSSTSGMGKSAFGSMLSQGRSDSFSDLRNPGNSKDFDDAFKSFRVQTQERQNTGGSATGSMAASRFDKEFPPIEEVYRDEDSDSENDKGFEDDFTSTAQPQQPPTTSPAPVEANNTGPPGIGAQASPPAYTPGTKGGDKDKNPFPEYSGLLPSRSDPMKHGPDTPGGSTNAVGFQGSGSTTTSPQNTGSSAFNKNNNLFNPSSPHTPAPLFSPPTTAPAPAPANPSLSDDFDDEFGDLAEAKESDEKGGDDDFGGFDDFNPVFEHSGGSTVPGTAISVDDDDFTTFNFNIDSPGQQGGVQGGQGVKKASSQDWDAIFADLGPGAGAGGSGNGATGGGTTAEGQKKEEVSSEDNGGVKLGEDDGVNKLAGMGFGRDRAAMALKKSGGDLEQAANSLLSEGEGR